MRLSPCRQGGVEVHETEAAVKNEYLADLDKEDGGEMVLSPSQNDGNGDMGMGQRKSYHLDDCIEVWSDFLRLHLHSKSLLMVPGHFHNE